MGLRQFARSVARRSFNLDVTRLDAFSFIPHVRRLGISLVFDVGANEGQYAKLLRANHYAGSIVSFEPAQEPFRALLEASKADSDWSVENCALGASTGTADLHISERSVMNSFLPLSADIAWAAATGSECVPVRRLDDIFSVYAKPTDAILLKIDVQGFEGDVLKGAEQSLSKIALVQLEGAVEPIYKGEPSFIEHIATMAARGFRLVDLHSVFRDDNGRLVHIDCLFERA